MNNSLRSIIEEKYRIKINDIVPGPRQFVAETFVLSTNSTKFFAKIIKYSKYSERTIHSLPVLKELHILGLDNINYPIKTVSNELYILSNDLLIILFNYIDSATQTFDFDLSVFGKLIASVHQKSNLIKAEINKEVFFPLYLEDFSNIFRQALNPSSSNQIVLQMKSFLQHYEEQIWKDWKLFLSLCDKCKNIDFTFLLTHGDPVGNILKNDKGGIYLVDWDDIMLAPAERDIWFLFDKPDFLNPYKAVFTQYKVNDFAYRYYVYNRFWEDIIGFIEEVLSDSSDEHREKNLNGLKKDCFTWLWPLIRKYD